MTSLINAVCFMVLYIAYMEISRTVNHRALLMIPFQVHAEKRTLPVKSNLPTRTAPLQGKQHTCKIRAAADGPRNFESRSNDVFYTSAGPPLVYPPHYVRTLSLERLMCIGYLYTAGLQWQQYSNPGTLAMSS
ncbi:hypothetical protein TNCV_4281341 [Trichonephila clavipes]|nr:hypothetical protein TNCV_4281341 [Trichonephila clavipes]